MGGGKRRTAETASYNYIRRLTKKLFNTLYDLTRLKKRVRSSFAGRQIKEYRRPVKGPN